MKYDGWTVQQHEKVRKPWMSPYFFSIKRNDLLMKLDMMFGNRERWQRRFKKAGYKIVKVKLVEAE